LGHLGEYVSNVEERGGFLWDWILLIILIWELWVILWRWPVGVKPVLFELVLFGFNGEKKIGFFCERVGKSGQFL